MGPPPAAFGNDPDGNPTDKAARLAARAARFNNTLPGNRYKELEEQRAAKHKKLFESGLEGTGQRQLEDAVDFRGTCEAMCCEYEIEFREYTSDIHPFEALPNRRMDHSKAVAAYTRSDAGAGHGAAAKPPADFRTPAALVRSLDYLVNEILPLQPTPNPNAVFQPPPSQRRALGNTAGFIRDRTRAIRKEFAMQSSWGHEEAIASFERIARWHILCLRELQEETGSNTDMHIDSAELGRCFVSLRQHYNDRREELQVDLPCPNEPEFRAYMLIFDLASKSVSIPTAELPAAVLDHPLVQLAWQIRQAAQRNFDLQKEGSKLNAEYGANLITRFVRLLKQQRVPYLLSCLVEVRLRDIRRSALRALMSTYGKLKPDQTPARTNSQGQVLDYRMILINSLDRILGAEEQEQEEPAWDDVDPVSKDPDDESAAVVERFGVKVYNEGGAIIGALINKGTPYNDNKDAPYTRRWKLITDKLGSASYGDVVNGHAGVSLDGAAAQPVKTSALRPMAPVFQPKPAAVAVTPSSSGSALVSSSVGSGKSAFESSGQATSAFANGSANGKSAFVKKTPAFEFGKSTVAPEATSKPPAAPPSLPPPSTTSTSIPNFFNKATSPAQPEAATATQPPSFFPAALPKVETPPVPQASIPNFFDNATKQPEAGPSTLPKLPSFTSLAPPPTVHTCVSQPSSPPKPPAPPAKPEIPRIKMSYAAARQAGPTLRERLIQEVLEEVMDDHKPYFESLVSRKDAAIARAAEQQAKREQIERDAELAYQRMVDDEVKIICWAQAVLERRSRDRVRDAFQHWRSWAATSAERRRVQEQYGLEANKRLNNLPLRRLNYSFTSGRSARSPSRMSQMSSNQEDMTLRLRQTQEAADEFWRPNTFLYIIMEHVARLIHRVDAEKFETVLLTAEHSATPAGAESRGWLKAKLSPPNGGELDYRGVDYCLTSTDVHGEFPGSSNAGLFVFEAPRNVELNQAQVELNAEDASDRLQSAAAASQQRSRYKSALLLVTWDNETQEELIGRLGIAADVQLFERVATLSLEYPDGVDDRFKAALEEVMPHGATVSKTRVYVRLSDVASELEEECNRILYMADILSKRHGDSVHIASAAITAVVNALSAIPGLIKDAIDPVPISADHAWEAPALPALHVAEGDAVDVASQITEYVSREPLSEVRSLALASSALRHAATQSHTLPIGAVLAALTSFVFTTLRQPPLPLDMWLDDDVEEAEYNIVSRIKTDFHGIVNREIGTFSRAARDVQEAADLVAVATPLPPSPKPKPKGKKRRHDDDESSTASAARRLRKLLAYHDKTFGELTVV